jgi:tetratricopeptide (TPR) repeat protein
VTLIEVALQINPQDAYFLNNRGFIRLLQNQLPEAEADIDQSMFIDPYNGWAYRNKGILYLLKKDYSSAERLLRKAMEIDPYIDRVHFYLGAACWEGGKKTEACDYLREAEKRGEGSLTTDQIKACR